MSHQQNSNSKTPKLRQYQREDIDFLKTNPCMACFNEPRTGKTATSVLTLVEQGITKILVICPKTGLYPWAEEFTRWTGLPAVVAVGTNIQKAKLISDWKDGALIVSYGAIKITKRSTGLLDAILCKDPVAVILDEAHRIKDRKSANALMAFALIPFIKFRIALTGTAAPGKPHEIWSILHFLRPEEFKSYWNFIGEYFVTHSLQNKQGRTYKEIGNIKPRRVADLQYLLNNIATQRKRKDVMKWLPLKEPPIRVKLPPTKEQTRYLSELKNYFETETIITQGILDRLIRYRQICLHPGLLGLKGRSPKIDWIKDYLSDYPERPTIIFTKFSSFIPLLERELTGINYRVIVGATPAKTRAEYIDEFQAGDFNLLILNIDAGKESITLDRAEAIIFTDKFPPIGDIQQAEDRFVATTEDKKDKLNLIYELVMEGTYDEALYALLDRRAAAVDAINDFKKYMKGDKHGTRP